MKIVVLGGAGKMGCIAVQDLAQDKRGKSEKRFTQPARGELLLSVRVWHES